MPGKHKCKCPEGVPDWVVTYGDMMSLLLCFFVLLFTFSEIKKPKEFEQVLEKVKEAFGYLGGKGKLPTQDMPLNSMIERLTKLALHEENFPRESEIDDLGLEGRRTTVKKIREGLQFTIGGLITFERGSADLKPEAKRDLARIARVIRGRNNKIEVRGHAAMNEPGPDSAYDNAWDLSYARAMAVKRFLTHPDQGIRERRIRVMACGVYEPLVRWGYDEGLPALNRRVEVIVTETLVRDFDAAPDEPSLSVINKE